MKWTIPFFLGMILCMQLVGQAAAAIVRERLNLGKDTCRKGETTKKERYSCICHGGKWACWDVLFANGLDCKAGELDGFMVDECNTCVCVKGNPACTMKNCDRMAVAEDSDKG